MPNNHQPPSGGCVLKQRLEMHQSNTDPPAAFGRLCVETTFITDGKGRLIPAAFGRLCVETKPS